MTAARIIEHLEPLAPRSIPGAVKLRAVGMLATRARAGWVIGWLARNGYHARVSELRHWSNVALELRDAPDG